MHNICRHKVPSCSTRNHPVEEPCRENPIALEKERSIGVALQNNALLLLLLLGQESGSGGMFENFTDSLVRLC